MQHYRTMETTVTALPHSTPVHVLATNIYQEVSVVWGKANLPMMNEKAAVQSITRLIQSWNKFTTNCNKSNPGCSNYEKYISMLDDVCGLAVGDEKQVKYQMHSSKLPTWKRDYTFYINQKAGVKDMVEGLDSKSVKRLKNIAAEKEKVQTRADKESVCASLTTEAASRETESCSRQDGGRNI